MAGQGESGLGAAGWAWRGGDWRGVAGVKKARLPSREAGPKFREETPHARPPRQDATNHGIAEFAHCTRVKAVVENVLKRSVVIAAVEMAEARTTPLVCCTVNAVTAGCSVNSKV